MDKPHAVASGDVAGVRQAAVRKLKHELGICPSQMPVHALKYLTRLHYCAASPPARDVPGSWGEHEMDYILFARRDVELLPNPEEVQAVRYVTLPQLQEMMAEHTGHTWSPWFRIIAATFLQRWWADLDATLGSEVHEDFLTIHRLEA